MLLVLLFGLVVGLFLAIPVYLVAVAYYHLSPPALAPSTVATAEATEASAREERTNNKLVWAGIIGLFIVLWLIGTAILSKDTDVDTLKATAMNGEASAQFDLGYRYQNGQGVPQSYVEAAKWYLKSVKQGNVAAQNNLGVLYENGQGVSQDNVEAYLWYCLANVQRNAIASSNCDLLLRKLTPEQIAECQRRAAAFVPRKVDSSR